MLKFKVRIKGAAPLLFNRFPEEDNPENKSKVKKAPETKDEQVEKSLYRDSDGKVFQPAEHIVGTMIKAATGFSLEGKKTYKDLVKGGVFVDPLKITHQNQKYVADWRSVVIKATRGRVMKGRGRMDDWGLQFTLTCIDPRATEQILREVLEAAGAYYGIGDYRPRYGRFVVEEFSKVEN